MPDQPQSEGPDRDLDAAFESIVARWSDEPVDPRRPEPTPFPRAPASPPAQTTGGVRIASGQVVPDVPAEGSAQEHFGFRGYTVPEEPEESFVPPAPAPMPDPEADPTFWTIVCCLIGGPLLMILLAVTGRTSMTWLMGAAVVATILGFVLLVLRGNRTPRDPDDDGARV